MIPQNTIDTIVKRLIIAYNPLQIYLYGDYVWDTPNEESSLDILIVVETSNERIIKRGYAAFEALLGFNISKNVIVLTKEEFDTYAKDQHSSTYEIKTRGKILYARP